MEERLSGFLHVACTVCPEANSLCTMGPATNPVAPVTQTVLGCKIFSDGSNPTLKPSDDMILLSLFCSCSCGGIGRVVLSVEVDEEGIYMT